MNCDFCKLEVEASDLVVSEKITVVSPMDSNETIVLYPSFSAHTECMDKFNTKRLADNPPE